ncbi:MAG: hypothetical protein U5L00_15610 [Desulfovermiculus sp.]|nr:hypothetical protein [Desulfovermiculus sp.]
MDLKRPWKTCGSMPLVEELGVDSVQLAHACRQISFGCFDEEMVVHETVSVAEPIDIRDHSAEEMQTHASIDIIKAYPATSIPRAITR